MRKRSICYSCLSATHHVEDREIGEVRKRGVCDIDRRLIAALHVECCEVPKMGKRSVRYGRLVTQTHLECGEFLEVMK